MAPALQLSPGHAFIIHLFKKKNLAMSTLYILYLFENTSRHFYLKHPLICMFIWKILIYLI